MKKRTIFDKNKIIKKNGYYEMEIYNKKCEVVVKTKFNTKLNEVKKYKWGLCISKKKNGRILKYVMCGSKNLFLHHLILKRKEGFTIDHINNNHLDNRIENLRYATFAENNRNMKSKGVVWDRGKWKAYISKNYKSIHLGRFTNKKNALKARRKAEQTLFGEFAYKY